jgi:NAD(P)-dependent dehydrogenase (short-subunit alcohol dehydrogenase family)
MLTILIMGANSDIAKQTLVLLAPHHNVIALNRAGLDLSSADAGEKIHKLLADHVPDVIINCAGKFGDNTVDYDSIFDVNVRSNWLVIQYYIQNPPSKPTRLIMLGSSVYKQGRRNCILYAASKAALHSIWQGASEFCSENFILGLINPVRVRTKMVSHLPCPAGTLEAPDVAEQIVQMCYNMNVSQSIDMDYKERP